MILRAVDVETSGLDPVHGASVVEIGWCDVVDLPKDKPEDVMQWAISAPRSILVNPGHPIPPDCSAVHHITDTDVAGAPKFSEALPALLKDGPDVVLCAHVAKFEQLFITVPATWICTWKVALHLAPNARSHSLQTLRYWLKLDVDRKLAEPPHRAGPDAYVCAHLIVRMLAKLTVQEMIEISSRPAVLGKLYFGKHAGVPIAQVPSDYLDWIIGQSGMDEDVRFTARAELHRRHGTP